MLCIPSRHFSTYQAAKHSSSKEKKGKTTYIYIYTAYINAKGGNLRLRDNKKTTPRHRESCRSRHTTNKDKTMDGHEDSDGLKTASCLVTNSDANPAA